MTVRWTTIVCVLAAAPAVASAHPTPERCEQGLAHAAHKDLPRAALYLEGCDALDLAPELADKVQRTRADVAHKLENSKLSAITIVTTPEGMVGETDALPGERFTTPATIWTKAGDYRINVAADAAALDAAQGLTTTASIDAFSRRTVIINVPQKVAAPKVGKVDFSDEPDEQAAHKGPPPAQKFGSILPKKYRKPGSEPSGGPQLEDPLAVRARDSDIAWRLGARIGGGLALRDASNAAGSFAVAAVAARTLVGPLSLATRLGWTHRAVDAGTLEVGVGVRVAASSVFVITVGAGVRGEVRLQDQLAMEEVARVGLGGAASVDVALLSVPLTVGLRAEPGVTELTPGVRAHAVLIELGYDWR